MPSKVAFSNKHSNLEDIEEYYVDSDAALRDYFLSPTVSPKFIGYSLQELQNELKIRVDSLDRMCSLEILSTLEARFRVDYLLRCQKKKRDRFSKKLRAVYHKKKNNASLVDDIIGTWRKEFPEHKTRLDNLQKALDYRNWLAHGRYWQTKKTPHISSYDYLSVYTLADEILGNIDLIES
ncbi:MULTISPECIES: hypothetical protein [Vibrio harveyi group]|uniref:hypothetical protein n=1 Tax=Vibrio harveyi group TaxID=717610 RepID=UPI0011233896|nr:hypothetical protein [Vibrio parahaemolyticus]MDG2594708.1 hypothetical protein [Vibrio parahaemolyticus]TOA69570.1 hypothetical protein CGK22_20390 [Vibrio parahaemolyticus]TOJ63408.1 hypothetical protein CGI34_21955 [Vibrio parahaemolyticus]